MLMSGHRNESSVRSYNRDCSSEQKKQISETLSSAVSHTATKANPDLGLDTSETGNATTTRSNEIVQYTNTLNNSSNFQSTGIISNSAFHNCVFNFSTER
jgi:hypothetical protein